MERRTHLFGVKVTETTRRKVEELRRKLGPVCPLSPADVFEYLVDRYCQEEVQPKNQEKKLCR